MKYLSILLFCIICVSCINTEKNRIDPSATFTNVLEDFFPGKHGLHVYEKDGGYKKRIRSYYPRYRHYCEKDSTYSVYFSRKEDIFSPSGLDDKHDYRIILCDSLQFDVNNIIMRDTTYYTYDRKKSQEVLTTWKILKSYDVNGRIVVAENYFMDHFHIPIEYALPVKKDKTIQ